MKIVVDVRCALESIGTVLLADRENDANKEFVLISEGKLVKLLVSTLINNFNYFRVGLSRSRRRRRESSSDRELPPNAHLQTDYPRQCYGPGCINSARYGSKYCSDDCGVRLATNRIYQVLPQRIQEWALSPCVAEEKNIKGTPRHYVYFLKTCVL